MKHETGELREGARFEPIKALFKRKPNHSWTARHAAQARSWVISGAWMQKLLKRKCVSVAKRKERKSTDCTTARYERRKGTKCQMT